MCTVAFFPRDDGGYRLGHNRDESRLRARGAPPERFAIEEIEALAPRDPEAGGTWIGVNAAGLTVCLLNAAEVDPSRRLAAPRSRGLLVRETLPLHCVEAVRERILARPEVLRETRAFHLVAAEFGAGGGPPAVARLAWDGAHSRWEVRRGSSLFVSSSLDPDGAERERREAWRRLLERDGDPDLAALERWLASHEPARGPLSVCMHRADARTVSRTLVEVSTGGIEMRYRDGPPCEPGEERVLRLRLTGANGTGAPLEPGSF